MLKLVEIREGRERLIDLLACTAAACAALALGRTMQLLRDSPSDRQSFDEQSRQIRSRPRYTGSLPTPSGR